MDDEQHHRGEERRKSDAERAALVLSEQAHYHTLIRQQNMMAAAQAKFAGQHTAVSAIDTAKVLAVLSSFNRAPADPVQLTDNEIARWGKECGYGASAWIARLALFVKAHGA